MRMGTESLVEDWLSEYREVDAEEFANYAASLERQDEVTTAVFRVLEDRNKYADYIEPVVSQLYSYYQSQCRQLQCYTLQFLPSLVFVSLNCVAHGDKQSCPTVEALLLGMYNQELLDKNTKPIHPGMHNQEVLDKNSKPRVYSFRLPSLAQASPYHDPMHLAPASLTESALRRLEECNTHLVQKGPYQPVSKLMAQNRLSVLSALMVLYNAQRSGSSSLATEFLCKAVSRLVTQGFNKQSSHQRSSYDSSLVPPTLPRIPINSEFLLELLEAVHLALYSKFSNLAQQSLEDIHFRASHELLPDVLVVTTALRNILHIGTSGPGTETAVVPSNMSPVMSSGPTLHKSLITNASFRTKKLPDDIPIQDKKDDGESKNLESISEEGVEGKSKPAKEGGIKVVKLPSLVKKKITEPKPPKGPKRKSEVDEVDEVVIFSPEMSPPPTSDQSDVQEFELKQRDSIV